MTNRNKERYASMTCFWPEPSVPNDHIEILLKSYARWMGRELFDARLPLEERARLLFNAPYAVLSHNTAPDPILNYGNKTALTLFEMTWEEFTRLPSRLSAEPMHREERTRMLARVASQGYIDDYCGIRISKSGRRFRIEQALVWALVDKDNAPYGQAALLRDWVFLN